LDAIVYSKFPFTLVKSHFSRVVTGLKLSQNNKNPRQKRENDSSFLFKGKFPKKSFNKAVKH
jgi:hypothetical protein